MPSAKGHTRRRLFPQISDKIVSRKVTAPLYLRLLPNYIMHYRKISVSSLVAGGLVAILMLILYLSTAAPGLTWLHDEGDLATAAYTGGIPHPPGYPTYMLAARLAIALQDGPIAARTNRLSALAGALTAGFVTLIAYRLMSTASDRLAIACATLSGLVYGVTPLAWSQALLTEIYTFGSFFAASAILIGLWLHDTWIKRSMRRFWAIGLLFGIVLGSGLGAHATIIFSAAFILLTLAFSDWYSLRALLPVGLGVLIGLSIFLILPLEANRSATSNWGDPSTLSGFLWVVTGAPYRTSLQWGIFPERIAFLAQMILKDFTLPGILLSVYGFWTLWDTRRAIALAMLVAVLANIQFVTMYYVTGTFPYLLTTCLFLAICFGVGLLSVIESLTKALPRIGAFVPISICLVVSVVIGYATLGNYAGQSLRNNVEADVFAQRVMDALPQNAIVFSETDSTTFALWYGQAVSRRRTDVAVIDTRMFNQVWYRETLARFYAYPTLIRDIFSQPFQTLFSRFADQGVAVFTVFEPEKLGVRGQVVGNLNLYRLTP